MVNISLASIEDKVWTNVCPTAVYGNATGSSDVSYWEGVTHGDLSAHQIGWTICGAFAAVNTLFAFFLILQHLRNYNKPEFQRIILLIPVYSIVSFLGYRYYEYSTYFELGLSFYESFAIASFFILILNMLGDEHGREKDVLSRDSWWFLETVKWLVLQYVVIEPVTAVVGAVTEATGHLCEESYSFQFAHVYLTIVQFSSVTLATYMLIQFYVVIRHDIQSFRPLWKFVAIKLVSICLSLLGYTGVIHATQYWTEQNIEYGLNSLIITVEMFLFCILDLWAYSWKEFVSKSGAPKRQVSIFRASVDALNFFDLFIEVGRNLRWFWHAVILRKEHIRHPEDARFDIHATSEVRKQLVDQETAAVYEDEEPNVEMKTATLTTYERAQLYDHDSDDGEEKMTSYLQYPATVRGAFPAAPYRSYAASSRTSSDTASYQPVDNSRRNNDDARVSRYLRDTRSARRS